MRKAIWFLLVGVLVACSSPSNAAMPTSPNSAAPALQAQGDPALALLEQYHWTPQASPSVQPFAIPDLARYTPQSGDLPFNLYLAASKAIHLDFTPWAGQSLELRTYPLGTEPKEKLNVYGHLLMNGNQVVGAWVSVEGQRPGIHALDTKVEDLIQT